MANKKTALIHNMKVKNQSAGSVKVGAWWSTKSQDRITPIGNTPQRAPNAKVKTRENTKSKG
jgi:hypothetical protein